MPCSLCQVPATTWGMTVSTWIGRQNFNFRLASRSSQSAKVVVRKIILRISQQPLQPTPQNPKTSSYLVLLSHHVVPEIHPFIYCGRVLFGDFHGRQKGGGRFGSSGLANRYARPQGGCQQPNPIGPAYERLGGEFLLLAFILIFYFQLGPWHVS